MQPCAQLGARILTATRHGPGLSRGDQLLPRQRGVKDHIDRPTWPWGKGAYPTGAHAEQGHPRRERVELQEDVPSRAGPDDPAARERPGPSEAALGGRPRPRAAASCPARSSALAAPQDFGQPLRCRGAAGAKRCPLQRSLSTPTATMEREWLPEEANRWRQNREEKWTLEGRSTGAAAAASGAPLHAVEAGVLAGAGC